MIFPAFKHTCKKEGKMTEHLPLKKRACIAYRESKRRAAARVDTAVADAKIVAGRPALLVRLCAGGTLGCCKLGEQQLNVVPVLDIDVREQHLGWDNSTVHVFTRKNRWSLLRAFAAHNPFANGPFKLAAGLEPGWYVPGVDDYEVGVGVLAGSRFDKRSDLNLYLHLLRSGYPDHTLIVLASPPCRMLSVCNKGEDPDDLKAYLKGTRRFLQRLTYAKNNDLFDHLLIECSAPGRYERGVFVPGKAASFMLKALGPGYTVKKLEAAKWGSPSLRNRLLFAENAVFDCLPKPLEYDKYRGWGVPVGVCKSSNLRLVARTWRGKEFAGKFPTEPSTCLTTMGLDMYADRDNDPEPTCVAIDAVSLAKTLGVDAFDPRLKVLANLPFRRACTLIGIGFSSQWYLAVLTAQLTAASLAGKPKYTGFVSKDHSNRVFWRIENWRRSRHPKPVPRKWSKIYKRKVKEKEKWWERQQKA